MKNKLYILKINKYQKLANQQKKKRKLLKLKKININLVLIYSINIIHTKNTYLIDKTLIYLKYRLRK